MQGYPCLISMPQAVDCESQPVTGACKMLLMSRRRPYLNRLSTNQSEKICFEMYSPTWLVTFHRNAFYAHEINRKLFVYMGDFSFKIHARAVRHVIAITRELPLEQWLTLSNRANPRKKYTDLFGHGYTKDLYNSPVSLGRAVCNRNEAFKQHCMIEASSSPGRWHQSSIQA